MNAPLSRFLVEFSAEIPVELQFEPIEPDVELVESEPTITLTETEFAERLAEAGQIAASEARAAQELALRSEFDDERARMTSTFEAARESWAHEQGVALSEGLTAAIAKLEGELTMCLTQALKPLFADALRDRVLTEIGGALSAILGDPGHPPVRLEGPDDLLSAFGTHYGNEIAIDYVVSEQTELTIVTDGTRITSCLGACLGPFKTREG